MGSIMEEANTAAIEAVALAVLEAIWEASTLSPPSAALPPPAPEDKLPTGKAADILSRLLPTTV